MQSYLDSSDQVLLEVDPSMPPEALKPMADILQKYGVTPVAGVVLDQKGSVRIQSAIRSIETDD